VGQCWVAEASRNGHGDEARKFGKGEGKDFARSEICNRSKSKGSLPKNNVNKCKLSWPTYGSQSMEKYK